MHSVQGGLSLPSGALPGFSFFASGAAVELDQRSVEWHGALLFLIQVVFGREEEMAARREQALCRTARIGSICSLNRGSPPRTLHTRKRAAICTQRLPRLECELMGREERQTL